MSASSGEAQRTPRSRQRTQVASVTARGYRSWLATLQRRLPGLLLSITPQVIKIEDPFLTSYVIFDKRGGLAEADTVEECQRFLQSKIDVG